MRAFFSFCIFGITFLLGNEMIVDSPKEITAAWEQKVFGIKYGITTLDNAVDEMVDRLIDDTFDTDFIQRIKAEIEKRPTGAGEYVEYWKNGSIKARLPYKDGKANGHLHGWYDNKRDAFKGYFKEGIKQGIHITFFKTESDYHIQKARLLMFNEQGQLEGDQDTFHPNGNLWIILPYKNGIAQGPLEGWDLNRKYFLSAQYEQGLLQKNPPLAPEHRPRPKPRINEKYVDEVTRDFIKIAKKECGVDAYSSEGSMLFDVEKIKVSFDINKKRTLDEARELIVILTEKFVEIINAHERLRPYLREYPFTPIRADIYLSFCNKRRLMNKEGCISRVLVNKDKQICYFSRDLNNPKNDTKFMEPYEEAVKLIHDKKKIAKNTENINVKFTHKNALFLMKKLVDSANLIQAYRKTRGTIPSISTLTKFSNTSLNIARSLKTLKSIESNTVNDFTAFAELYSSVMDRIIEMTLKYQAIDTTEKLGQSNVQNEIQNINELKESIGKDLVKCLDLLVVLSWKIPLECVPLLNEEEKNVICSRICPEGLIIIDKCYKKIDKGEDMFTVISKAGGSYWPIAYIYGVLKNKKMIVNP